MIRPIAQSILLLATMTIATSIDGSQDSMGPNGINSIVTMLNGTGVAIGQVEGGRPGSEANQDTMQVNDEVVPTDVFIRDEDPDANESVDDHALWVASVMISRQTEVASPERSAPIGVAQQAQLYSSAFLLPLPGVPLQDNAALAAQHLAKTLEENSPFVNIRAINMSFGLELDDSSNFLDGSSTLTSFVDWSAAFHDVLYVIAGNEARAVPSPVPTDNFNGITVAASYKANDGVYRRVDDSFNQFGDNVDAFGTRTSTDLVAPGVRVDTAGENGTQPPLGVPGGTGTSFAAPHVTGTIALLHQAAAGLANDARRHQVMKAVLLNSADKIKGIIGMERTVLDGDGDDWFLSDADDDPAIPLDRQMGAGHLNANRAVDQLTAGRFGEGSVPRKGWDFRTQDDRFNPNKYILPQLSQGDFVSVTLVWDRLLVVDLPEQTYEAGADFVEFGFNNLDLYLVPAGMGVEQAVSSSTSNAWNLEHIFFKIPATNSYEIWVVQNEPENSAIQYALAWWAGEDARPQTAPGDHNGDGTVNGADYVAWRKLDESSDGYNQWRTNFGTTPSSGGSGNVPEPNGIVLTIGLVIGAFMFVSARREI